MYTELRLLSLRGGLSDVPLPPLQHLEHVYSWTATCIPGSTSCSCPSCVGCRRRALRHPQAPLRRRGVERGPSTVGAEGEGGETAVHDVGGREDWGGFWECQGSGAVRLRRSLFRTDICHGAGTLFSNWGDRCGILGGKSCVTGTALHFWETSRHQSASEKTEENEKSFKIVMFDSQAYR